MISVFVKPTCHKLYKWVVGYLVLKRRWSIARARGDQRLSRQRLISACHFDSELGDFGLHIRWPPNCQPSHWSKNSFILVGTEKRVSQIQLTLIQAFSIISWFWDIKVERNSEKNTWISLSLSLSLSLLLFIYLSFLIYLSMYRSQSFLIYLSLFMTISLFVSSLLSIYLSINLDVFISMKVTNCPNR